MPAQQSPAIPVDVERVRQRIERWRQSRVPGAPPSSAFWAMNVMRLGSPQSAILSAVIFNAVVIVALIPLALRGVSYRPLGAAALLRRNLLVYGVGGVIAPFVAIKAIDVLVTGLGLA